jgi:D-sedoheptulose 7-phosphate isomerase
MQRAMKKRVRSVNGLMGEYVREHQLAVEKSFPRLKKSLTAVGEVLVTSLKAGHKVLVFGNGGSATEASHFAGELMGRFSKTPRRPLPAVALSCDPAVVTCIGNDFGYESVFERQVEALAEPDDIVFGLTTSGKSENVLRGLKAAERKRATTVALTGAAGLQGGKAQHLLDVPSTSPSSIQEVHLIFLHVLCICIDRAFIEKSRKRGKQSNE